MNVRVIAPGHVHIGNFDIHGGLGRLYGTAGFAVEAPRLVIEVSLGNDYQVEGTNRVDDALYYAKLASKMAGCGPLKVKVVEEIPAHVGLGSTTALALSIGASAKALCGSTATIEEIARVMGRGKVSALGVYSFKYGGFIVDGGFRADHRSIPPLIYRSHVPSKYKMIIALPERPIPRILDIKKREDEILESLPKMDEAMAMEASRLILLGVIANISEGSWENAGRWITELNKRLGTYWSKSQGGIYCCRESEIVINSLLKAGALAAAQSSWGPTVYALVDAGKARGIYSSVQKVLEELGGGKLWLTKVDNIGARIIME